MMRKWGSYWFEIVLVLVILGMHLYAAAAPANNMMAWYSTDDAFYYFKVAQNISQGFGSTFDRISPTNGYHPLWMLICVPVFSLARFDLITPLRILIMISAAISALTAVLLYRMCKRVLSKETGMLVAAFWAFTPRIHGVTVELGMEAGINALMVVTLAYAVLRWEERKSFPGYRYRDLVSLGFVAVLTMFSRLDNMFIVGMVGLWLIWRSWSLRPWNDAGPSTVWMHRFKVALSYFLPVGVALLVYMAWNYFAFGTPSPVSGQIKRWWGTLNNTAYGYPVDNFWVYLSYWFTRDQRVGPWSMLFGFFHDVAAGIEQILNINAKAASFKNIHRLVVLVLGLAFSGGAFLLIKSNWNTVKRAITRFSLLPLFLGCMIQFTSYPITHYVNYHPWYWASEMAVTVIALAVLVECLIGWLRKIKISPRALQAGVLVLVLVMLFRFDRMMADFITWKVDPVYYDGYLWGAQGLEKATPPGAVIGTPGGGAIAYFIKDRTVINLDGLVNSYEYFQLLQTGKAGAYYDRIGLKYVYGNQYMIMDSEPYWHAFKGRVIYLDNIVSTNLYQYLGSQAGTK